MKKGLHYFIAAIALAGIAWFGYHWQRGSDPLARFSQVAGPDQMASSTGTARQKGAGPEPGGAGKSAAGASAEKPGSGKPGQVKPGTGKSGGGKPGGGRPGGGPVGVKVATVVAGTVEERVEAVGSLLAAQSVLIKPEIDGRIAQIHVSDGSAVKLGEPLFKLDSVLVDAEVAQAQAELSLALSNLRRTKNLASQNFVSRRSRDEAQSNVAVLRARMQVVKARQSRTEISAPFDGRVGLVPVSVGDYIKSGTDLVRLDDLSTLKIDIRVPERLLAQVKTGQVIRISIDAYPGKKFTARVQTIDSEIDQAGRSIVVRGRLNNEDGLLRPGMFARAALVMASRDNALLIPEAGVIPEADGKYVYRVRDGQAARVLITTGVRQDGMVEVLSGLNLGEQIVSAGQIKLRGPQADVRILSD
ncbi:MAG: efflux RND transporter periplasmic adaptor subunit [Burkholderiaceae bacterium]